MLCRYDDACQLGSLGWVTIVFSLPSEEKKHFYVDMMSVYVFARLITSPRASRGAATVQLISRALNLETQGESACQSGLAHNSKSDSQPRAAGHHHLASSGPSGLSAWEIVRN